MLVLKLLEVCGPWPLVIIGGLFLLVFLNVVFGRGDDEVQQLDERHSNQSIAENGERIYYVEQARKASTAEERAYWQGRYREAEVIHQQNWKGRVRNIVNKEVRISEQEMAELDAGVNPYKQPKETRRKARRGWASRG